LQQLRCAPAWGSVSLGRDLAGDEKVVRGSSLGTSRCALRQTAVAEALSAGMEMLLHLLATLNVGCGSLVDISAPPANVRFTHRKVDIAQHRVHVRFVPIGHVSA